MIDVLDNLLKLASDNCENVITINVARENPVDVIKAYTNNKGVDIAFEAVGHAEHIPDVLNPVRGCVQSIRGPVLSVCLVCRMSLFLWFFKEMIWKEAKIIASRVNHGEFADTLKYLEMGLSKPGALISKIMKGPDTQSAFNLIEKEKGNYLKVLLDFR